jgi:hypothetical protein
MGEILSPLFTYLLISDETPGLFAYHRFLCTKKSGFLRRLLECARLYWKDMIRSMTKDQTHKYAALRHS